MSTAGLKNLGVFIHEQEIRKAAAGVGDGLTTIVHGDGCPAIQVYGVYALEVAHDVCQRG